MNESDARAVTLLQAFETVQPPAPSWSEDDRAWATRIALTELPGRPEPVDAALESFVVRRTRHALQRLAPREPGAAAWLVRRFWSARWVGWAALAGALLGLLADSIGSSQHVNLLAPPFWGLIAWNAAVYLLLLAHALATVARRPTRPGVLVRGAEWLMRLGRQAPRVTIGASGSPVLRQFATLWWRRSAGLSTARATTLLHAAAAALALGLIGGLYLRGLVLDYRAGWESTFLSAAGARTLLELALGPAARLAGIGLPDAAAFEAMRTVHGQTLSGAPAGPWIHLLALTLCGFVVLPRCVLAAVAALRARWLATHLRLPLDDPYLQRLARLQRGDVAWVVVQPYACVPAPDAGSTLERLLRPLLGEGLRLEVAPVAAFGAEDETAAPLASGSTLAIALFDLSATPEPETQGRYARQLAARAPGGAAAVVLVEEGAFRARFGAGSSRLRERREAWQRFGEALDTTTVFVDLAQPDSASFEAALQSALRRPIARPA